VRGWSRLNPRWRYAVRSPWPPSVAKYTADAGVIQGPALTILVRVTAGHQGNDAETYGGCIQGAHGLKHSGPCIVSRKCSAPLQP
jgi:hypothetical protein